MSQYSPEYIESMNLVNDLFMQTYFTRHFDAPVNKELLAHLLCRIHDSLNEEDEGSKGQAVAQNYTDFLLPLPESLRTTETGMVHPDIVNHSQAARGLNTKMNANHRQANELKHAKELKQKLAHQQKLTQSNAPRPKMGMVPTPFGTTRKEQED